MNDKERIERLYAYSNCTWKQLATKLGVKSVQSFLDIRNGRINISSQMQRRILEKFPEVNPLWLSGDAENMLIEGYRAGSIEIYFPNATDSLYYNGKGMVEYPRSCLLMLHRVSSVANIVSGENYLIETPDYKIARKVITENKDTLRLVATDKSTDNGTLIYKDVIVDTDDILKMYSIIGYIVPERIE